MKDEGQHTNPHSAIRNPQSLVLQTALGVSAPDGAELAQHTVKNHCEKVVNEWRIPADHEHAGPTFGVRVTLEVVIAGNILGLTQHRRMGPPSAHEQLTDGEHHRDHDSCDGGQNLLR